MSWTNRIKAACEVLSSGTSRQAKQREELTIALAEKAEALAKRTADGSFDEDLKSACAELSQGLLVLLGYTELETRPEEEPLVLELERIYERELKALLVLRQAVGHGIALEKDFEKSQEEKQQELILWRTRLEAVEPGGQSELIQQATLRIEHINRSLAEIQKSLQETKATTLHFRNELTKAEFELVRLQARKRVLTIRFETAQARIRLKELRQHAKIANNSDPYSEPVKLLQNPLQHSKRLSRQLSRSTISRQGKCHIFRQ